LYYKYDRQRLPTCTLNIHSLLHIADGIEACGPVWAYWVWALERYCGSLLRSLRNRRFPFASLDKRITEISQLRTIKNLYDLHDHPGLRLRRTRKVEGNGVPIPGCKSQSNVPGAKDLMRILRSDACRTSSVKAHPPCDCSSTTMQAHRQFL
jgi:hypothetical protein